jgi:predicted nucleic acid-binding protein
VNVLIDTTIWSLALRRRRERLNGEQRQLVAEWDELVAEGRARLLGMVRQETLSGIAVESEFRRLRTVLRAFVDVPVVALDHELAAEGFNRCRANGIQGTPVDLLICAVAQRLNLSIFTTDADFWGYARFLPIQMHQVRSELR